ncbi:capsid protein [Dirofilaria immitis]
MRPSPNTSLVAAVEYKLSILECTPQYEMKPIFYHLDVEGVLRKFRYLNNQIQAILQNEFWTLVAFPVTLCRTNNPFLFRYVHQLLSLYKRLQIIFRIDKG